MRLTKVASVPCILCGIRKEMCLFSFSGAIQSVAAQVSLTSHYTDQLLHVAGMLNILVAHLQTYKNDFSLHHGMYVYKLSQLSGHFHTSIFHKFIEPCLNVPEGQSFMSVLLRTIVTALGRRLWAFFTWSFEQNQPHLQVPLIGWLLSFEQHDCETCYNLNLSCPSFGNLLAKIGRCWKLGMVNFGRDNMLWV